MRFLTAFLATLSTSAAVAVYAQAVAPIVASDHVTTPTKFTTALPTGDLPDPATFKAQNGTKWKIEYVGDLHFSGTLGTNGLGGDKCRSSVLGDKVIWNCGDMECAGDWRVCGFSMGPAFYGTNSVMVVNTTGIALVQDNDFATAWSGDPAPQAPQTAWGMDTSNVAAINDTHGIAYAWEIWRGAPDGSFVDRGNAVVAVTLGEMKPIATRVGPLLSGPDAVQMGLLAILRDGNHIYSYSMGGPSGIMVSRVAASDDALEAAKYEFLVAGESDSSMWKIPGSIPAPPSAEYGMQTANSNGKFGCNVYGSVFYSNYLRKYVIICTAYMHFTKMDGALDTGAMRIRSTLL
ncbi:hypothetical protein DBV05_g7895 [Lasiodiplodia theobromae]|uniref:Uncharacterized protein n=1 Tax=Lasiodiplodia theobromae TaxID=45133 RepID=A0A5N5D7C9_9PEZI|nr:hypothetical protein DBV05_g7895 [Lasiodiplodia theobromae]